MKKYLSLSAALLMCFASTASVFASPVSDSQTTVQQKERKQLESGEKKCTGPQKKVRTKY